MLSIVFIYVGDIKVCLDRIGGGFYIAFGVAFIDRNTYQWDNCCRCDVSRILWLLCSKMGVY